jgi:hypothetical protein
MGHVFFQDDALGHDDLLRIEMQGVPPAPQGKSYSAWAQESGQRFLPLGPLTMNNGSVSFLYTNNTTHTNLLSLVQGVIVTQEDDGSTRSTPSGATLYQARFDTTSLPYIRDILYATPDLPAHSSVVNSMFESIKSMNDKSGSIADSLQVTHAYDLAIRQAIRIIEMVDGTAYARSSGDLPARYPSLLEVPIGLISSSTHTGYIDILARQLDNLQPLAAKNPTLEGHVQNVRYAVTDLKDWLQQVHNYDIQLLHARSLSNAMALGSALQLKQFAADAYTGRTIPPNAGPLPTLGSAGAYQAYTESQYMAALDMHHV